MQYKSDEVLKFIGVFQSPSNKILFTDCACYWFAKILSQRFSNSCIMYNPHESHFATMIGSSLYDISGTINDISDFIIWDEEFYKYINPVDYYRVKDGCIDMI